VIEREEGGDEKRPKEEAKTKSSDVRDQLPCFRRVSGGGPGGGEKRKGEKGQLAALGGVLVACGGNEEQEEKT